MLPFGTDEKSNSSSPSSSAGGGGGGRFAAASGTTFGTNRGFGASAGPGAEEARGSDGVGVDLGMVRDAMAGSRGVLRPAVFDVMLADRLGAADPDGLAPCEG